MWLRCFVPALLATVVSGLAAQNAGAPRPDVWMIPPGQSNGECFRELFTQPDAWQETRKHVTVLGYADHVLNKQLTDDELRTWLPMIGKWGLKLGLEVGAVKPWGPTGEKTFKAEYPMWDRFQSLGGPIYAIAMDEPLCCTRFHLKEPDAYAVEQTAQFISLVRKRYPAMRIGDIEPYPGIPREDLLAWIDALQAKLAEMHVRGLDFFRVDVDWDHFTFGGPGSWLDLRKLAEGCHQRKLPFSLIYWAADYTAMKRKGLADDSTWYVSIMQQAYDYALVGGRPDEFVIESWVGAPSHCVPETGEWTFTRSVLDFCRKFVEGGK